MVSRFYTIVYIIIGFSLPMVSLSAQSKISRKPASTVPNDDVIVVPVEAKMTFYERNFLQDKSVDVGLVQQQIKLWQENANLALQYGLDQDSIGSQYFVPTNTEKWQYIQRSYFRYLKRQGEQPLKDESQAIMRQWNADKEINSIDEMEATFRSTTKKVPTGQNLPSSFQEKEVSKSKKFRMYFQPRIEQGLMIVRMTSSIVDGRAWIGFNGDSEVNLQRSFDFGTRVMFNYFTNNQQYLTSIDQNLGHGFSARYIHSYNPTLIETNSGIENRFQVGFNAEF
jgi:hypothetical protein